MNKKASGQKTIPIHMCETGDVLARDVHNPSGQKVVSKDKELTAKIIKRLSGAGVRRVAVYSDEIEEPETFEKKQEKKQPEHEVKETDEGLLVSGDLSDEFSGDQNVILEGDLLEGARLTADGDVRIKGEVSGGKIISRGGKISINGALTGSNIELITDKLVDVASVEEAEVSVEGNLLVHGEVTEADIDCVGDMIVHQKQGKAQLADSNIRVEGKLFADEVENTSSADTRLVFEDPKKKALKQEKSKLVGKVEELEQEYAKLQKIVETVRQLGNKVKQLSPEKKKKLKKHTRRFGQIKNELSKSEENIEKTEQKLEELQKERRYFMKVLNTLRKDTEITMDNTMIKVDEDEWDVKLYKKSMIVIQDAEDDSDNVSEWLKDN
ncbi:MAG: FapA family protein [bacterium]